MTSTSTTVQTLHYLAPVLAITYWIGAKLAAACLLQTPPNRKPSRVARYLVIALQLAVLTTVLVEGVSTIVPTFRTPDWSASQDFILHLFLLSGVHACFTVSLLESATPLWHPDLGAWLVSLALELPIAILPAIQKVPETGYARVRVASRSLRCALLLVLVLLTASLMLQGRGRSVKLDDESERLLANGAHRRPDGIKTRPSETSCSSSVTLQGSGDEGTDGDDDADPDSEMPDRDKEVKAQQRKRLQESGNWFSYMKDFKIFIPLLIPRKNRVAQICFAIIGTVIAAQRALNILQPRQMGIIVNELNASAGNGVLPWKSIGLWMLYVSLNSRVGLPLAQALAKIPIKQFGYKAISTTAFRHIMMLDMKFHSSKNSGELIRIIDQGTVLQQLLDFMCFDVLPMFFDLIAAFGYIYVLFDVYMALIPLAVGVAYVYVGTKTTRWSIKYRRDFNTMWRAESKVQNEAINNWQTVSHFNRAQYEGDRYSNTVDQFNASEWKYTFIYQIGGGTQNIILLIGRLAAVTLAVWRVCQGRASTGSFVTLVSYWSSVEYPLMNVSYSVARVSGMLVDSERLLQLLRTKSSIVDAPDAPPLDVTRGEIEFDHVGFAYDVRRPTLKNVSFTVKPGQTVALVGETGGGKSTILKLLYRYFDVDSGAIRIDGQDIRNVTQDSLRDSFGMVPQDPSLFNTTLMENLKYARLSATDADVHAACRAAAIHDKIESFPDKYLSIVGERGVRLSGGEQQRIAVAQAFLRQPRILLLDEATSMIDAETEAVIQGALKTLARGRTTFVVAHRLSTVQHADLILVINEGEVVERGTHEELFRLGGRYVALWAKQVSKEVKEVGAALHGGSGGEVVGEVPGGEGGSAEGEAR